MWSADRTTPAAGNRVTSLDISTDRGKCAAKGLGPGNVEGLIPETTGASGARDRLADDPPATLPPVGSVGPLVNQYGRRQAPVSSPRSSMNCLKRSRSFLARRWTAPVATPAFSTGPWGSKFSSRSTPVRPASIGVKLTWPEFVGPSDEAQ